MSHEELMDETRKQVINKQYEELTTHQIELDATIEALIEVTGLPENEIISLAYDLIYDFNKRQKLKSSFIVGGTMFLLVVVMFSIVLTFLLFV
mgnify:CR=1 FL=1